jgi:hypothetical protein
MNSQIKALLNHLLETYTSTTLERVFGINSDLWRQHKAWSKDNKKGTKLSPKHYANIKKQYIEFLEDRLREVRDVDFSNDT